MIGQTVAHYRVLELLGGGGMGVVYRAQDLRLGREVALKFLPPELLRDEEARARLLREARAASALNHPHICTLHELGEHAGQPFLVLEHLEGETLKDRLNRGPLAFAEVLRLAVQLTDGLAAAHGAGIVHRDLKPANLFLTRRGDVKILDFGLAKVIAAQGGGAEPETLAALTSPGAAPGTLGYMSPEQARGEPLDTRSDLFSLGATLYEMASGRRAFAGETAATTWDAILHQEPPPPSRGRPDLPDELDRIAAKALEKDRTLRYQSATELRADLERLQRDSQPNSSATVARREAPRRRWRRTAWAALATVLVGTGVLIGWRSLRVSPPAKAGQTAVAVLPFQQLGDDEELQYLRLALPDEITTALTYAPALAVRPFDREALAEGADPRQLARRLRASWLVRGHFATEGAHLSVTLEAVDPEADRLVWRERLTVPVAEVLSLREEVAARVRYGLLPSLGIGSSGGGGTRPADAGAYEMYLRSLAASRDPEPNKRAIGMLERAVAADRGFAPAWAELATRYSYHEQYGGGGLQARQQGKAAGRQALELDPALVAARIQLITMEAEEGDLDSAYRDALALILARSDSAEAHFAIAYVLRYGGLPTEARRHCETALALDPTNHRWRSCAFPWLAEGDLDRAAEFARLDEGSYWTTLILVALAVREGDTAGARREMERLAPEDPNRRFFTACLAGARPVEEDVIAEFAALWAPQIDPEPEYWLASSLALCGMEEAAFRHLERAVGDGYCSFPGIDRDPAWARLRAHPELQRIRGRAIACRDRFRAVVEAIAAGAPDGLARSPR